MGMISASYLNNFPAAAGATASYVDLLIAGMTAAIEMETSRSYYARRETADGYPPLSGGRLVLRKAPLIALNSLVISPDVSPVTFTQSNFDIRYKPGVIAFNATTQGTFFSRYDWGLGQRGQLNQTVVDYFHGFGWLTTLTAPVAPGANVTLPLAALSGVTPEQGYWSVGNTGSVLLDSGLATEEAVIVTVTAGTYGSPTAVTASNVQYNHASGGFVSGPLAPASAQLACAIACCNVLNQPDFTKKTEGVGRIGGYVTAIRDCPSGAIFTPEVLRLLGPVADVVV